MAKKKKFYVVWEGNETGIFKTWGECQLQIKGYPNAKYKSFPSLEAAEAAYHGQFNDCLLYTSPSPRDRTRSRMPSSA